MLLVAPLASSPGLTFSDKRSMDYPEQDTPILAKLLNSVGPKQMEIAVVDYFCLLRAKKMTVRRNVSLRLYIDIC